MEKIDKIVNSFLEKRQNSLYFINHRPNHKGISSNISKPQGGFMQETLLSNAIQLYMEPRGIDSNQTRKMSQVTYYTC